MGEVDYSCSYFYFLWGRHAELLLRFEEALEAYENVLICDPEAEYVSEKIPVLLLRLERTEEASLWLSRYLLEHPDRTGMRMLYAKVLTRLKKNEEAMRQYKLISDRHPDDPTIQLVLAEMYLSGKHYDRARAVLERILGLDPASYPAHLLMARLEVMEEAPVRAAEHYRQALARNWSAELHLELGELYVKTGNYDEAAAQYKAILEREEQNESARIALVHVYLLQKKDTQALAELKSLRSFVDQPQRVDLTIARLHARQKRFDKAIALTEQILSRESLPEARFFLAALHAQAKRYDQALKQLRLIDRKTSEFAEALTLQVRILSEQNRLEEAVRLLEENIALADTVRSPELYLLLASLHQQQGKQDLARRVLMEGIEAYPEDEDLLYEYGLLLENSGEHEAALQVMEKIIELKPDNAAALNFVGYSWADEKVHLDQALTYIQRAIELKPDNGYIRDSLGWVYFRLGKFDLAIKELETATTLSPDDPAILEHLGDAYLGGGLVRKALEAYRKALKLLDGNDKERGRILEKIWIIEQQGPS
jgi:tetratricopeptide (TPR) repeat protein